MSFELKLERSLTDWKGNFKLRDKSMINVAEVQTRIACWNSRSFRVAQTWPGSLGEGTKRNY